MLPEFLQLKLHESGVWTGLKIVATQQWANSWNAKKNPNSNCVLVLPECVHNLTTFLLHFHANKQNWNCFYFVVSCSLLLLCLFSRFALIKPESSSSPLHVHTLYEIFYRTEAIRVENMLQLTRYVEEPAKCLLVVDTGSSCGFLR